MAADPGTDMGEVEAEATGKWKMKEHGRRNGRGRRSLFRGQGICSSLG